MIQTRGRYLRTMKQTTIKHLYNLDDEVILPAKANSEECIGIVVGIEVRIKSFGINVYYDVKKKIKGMQRYDTLAENKLKPVQ